MSNYRDENGNYIETTGACVHCGDDVTITAAHREEGNGPWCSCCSAVICETCWTEAGSVCSLCTPETSEGARKQASAFAALSRPERERRTVRS